MSPGRACRTLPLWRPCPGTTAGLALLWRSRLTFCSCEHHTHFCLTLKIGHTCSYPSCYDPPLKMEAVRQLCRSSTGSMGAGIVSLCAWYPPPAPTGSTSHQGCPKEEPAGGVGPEHEIKLRGSWGSVLFHVNSPRIHSLSGTLKSWVACHPVGVLKRARALLPVRSLRWLPIA